MLRSKSAKVVRPARFGTEALELFNMRSYSSEWMVGLSWVDQVSTALLLAVACNVVHPVRTREVLVLLLIVPWWHFLHSYFGFYRSYRVEGISRVVSSTFTATSLGFSSAALALWLLNCRELIIAIGLFSLLWLLYAVCLRTSAYAVLHHLRRRGLDQHQVCVIGSLDQAEEIAERFQRFPEWGLRVSAVGLGSPENRIYVTFPDTNEISHSLEEVLKREVIDELLIAKPADDLAKEFDAIELCRSHGLQCRLQFSPGFEAPAQRVENVDGKVVMTVSGLPHKLASRILKRGMDIILSATLLILVSPIMLCIAILVKLSSPGPILFRQLRAGVHGRRFEMFKFRTMVDGAESLLHSVAARNSMGGPTFKDPNDLRITPLGRILRRLSLDEFPQLWNILRGEMSLVGPRPLPLHEATVIQGTFRRRFSMRPGLTCYWQVAGRSNISFEKWMQLDIEYVDHWTLGTDMVLLLRTIPAVLSGRGAY